MNLYLVRHGESMGDALNLIEGRADFPLTARGKKEAEICAKYFECICVDHIYTSPLIRSVQTAQIIGGHIGLEAIPEDAFISYDNGAIAGLTLAEADIKYPKPEVKYPHTEIYGMESMIDFRTRVEKGLYKLLFEMSKDTNCIIVTHGGVINMICNIFLGIPITSECSFSSSSCSVTHLVYDKEQGKAVKYINRKIIENE